MVFPGYGRSFWALALSRSASARLPFMQGQGEMRPVCEKWPLASPRRRRGDVQGITCQRRFNGLPIHGIPGHIKGICHAGAILRIRYSLFFIRKMRCESAHFGVKFSKAPLRGGRRYAPCTPTQDRAAVWRKNGFEPHFGAILDFFWPRKMGKGACFHALNTGRCPRLHLCCGVSPSRAIQPGEKNMRQETA